MIRPSQMGSYYPPSYDFRRPGGFFYGAGMGVGYRGDPLQDLPGASSCHGYPCAPVSMPVLNFENDFYLMGSGETEELPQAGADYINFPISQQAFGGPNPWMSPPTCMDPTTAYQVNVFPCLSPTSISIWQRKQDVFFLILWLFCAHFTISVKSELSPTVRDEQICQRNAKDAKAKNVLP